jgi:F0F1-type ATP synthase delta subunit
MTKKQIKSLVLASYTNDKLDTKKINRITKILTRFELKEYIKSIKFSEKSKTITIYTPNVSTATVLKKEIGKIFQNKKIEVIEDKKLIAGIKVIDNDDVYDFSIRNNIKNLVSYIN